VLRLLAARLDELVPLELPAAPRRHRSREGEDGRIKSAIGSGRSCATASATPSRLLDEDSPTKSRLPDLLAQIPVLANSTLPVPDLPPALIIRVRAPVTPEIELAGGMKCGGDQTIRVVVTRATFDHVAPESGRRTMSGRKRFMRPQRTGGRPAQRFLLTSDSRLVTVRDGTRLPAIAAFRLLAAKLRQLGRNNPIC